MISCNNNNQRWQTSFWLVAVCCRTQHPAVSQAANGPKEQHHIHYTFAGEDRNPPLFKERESVYNGRRMVITYHGGTFFKVVFGDTTIAFDPISKKSKLKQTRFGADIALISGRHPDLNGVENVTHGDKAPFVISGPGEYEVKKVTVLGFASDTSGINTIYVVTLEGMKLCFLGTLGDEQLSQETLEALDDIDILFLPIGGDGVLEPAAAHKLSVKLEPRVVIPTCYTDAALKLFLKEEGAQGAKPTDKLTIKKKDIETMEGEIVILKE